MKGTHDGESGMQGKDVDGAGSPFKAGNGKSRTIVYAFRPASSGQCEAAHVSA